MEYWASGATRDVIREGTKRKDSYYNWLLTSGRLARWRTAYDTYYGQRGTHSSQYVTAAGDQGELSFLMSNEYRSLVQSILTLATQSRPATECIAVNTDFRSQAQAILGNDLLEHYFREKKVERVMKRTLETSLIMDLSWLIPMWDTTLGKDVAVDPDTELPVKEGDVRCISRTPLDVVIDYTRIDPDFNNWVIVRDSINKFDAAALRPERADEIKGLKREMGKDALFRFGDSSWQNSTFETDEIDRWTLLHARTLACGEGRMLQWVGNDIDLFDGPLPFRELNVVRCCPTEQILSVFGYSNSNDLLSLQDVFDACISAAATNMTSVGVNTLWMKTNSNIDFRELAKGMGMIESDEKPEVLMMNRMSPESFQFLELVLNRMQTISGVNAVARGDLQGKDLSGSAMALLQSMSIQFNSGVQAAYGQLIEDTGTHIILQLQDFAKEDRVAITAGKARGYMTKEFNASKIDKIQRVYVNQANPYRNTISGRIEIAKEWAQLGFIKSPEQYVMVLETGRLDTMIEDITNLEMNIRRENEDLLEGQRVPVLAIDHHQKHILGHLKNLEDPEARRDPNLVIDTLMHIQEHLLNWQIMPPSVLAALGIPPLPPAMPGQMPMIPGMEQFMPQVMQSMHEHGVGVPTGGPAPGMLQPPMGPRPVKQLPPGAGAQGVTKKPDHSQAPGVNMPNQPRNPLSGQRAQAQPGAPAQ
jgi:hypothetical protein